VSVGSTTRSVVSGIAIVGVLLVTIVEVVLLALRPESGLGGLLQLVAPHLALIGLVLAFPALLWIPIRVAIVADLLLVGVLVIRFGTAWLSLPPAQPPADAERISMNTWNLQVGARSPDETVAFLRAHPADVIALQELLPADAAAIEADPELVARYPYRLLDTPRSSDGLGLLSRFPLLDHTFRLEPLLQQATLDLGEGRLVQIVHTHPQHSDLRLLPGIGLPIGMNVTGRNAELGLIRSRVDAARANGPTILVGDLNTAPTEPAFDRLASGLLDVQQEVGQGPGWTWRPGPLEALGLGLLAIDHVIVTPGIEPLAIGSACPPVGDHCLVSTELAIPAP
jgi:endonuclease/exonuclease/phosphatase (EEP) superfamily protein YafD